MNVTTTPATRSHEPAIQNLIQLYTHDFSEYWSDSPKGQLQDDGRFPPYPLEAYWTDPAYAAFLIRRDGELAGFALIANRSHTGQRVDHSMAEFFIARKYRSRGLGREAAKLILSQRPGWWEVAIARKNVPALSFWRRIVGSLANVRDLHEIDVNDQGWNGPILRFEWR